MSDLPKLLRSYREGGEREAIIDAVKFIEACVAPRRCDSDGVSDCVRCNAVYLARVLKKILNEPQRITATLEITHICKAQP